MPSRKEIRTPVASPATRGFAVPTTPQDYISPSTRRHIAVSNQSPLLMNASENDDEAEKRARRRSKVIELQRRHLSSPGTPSDRRRSTPLSGLSNVQLTDHYASCIKLSAENKINAKNAFGLHLIDYMSDLLKKKEMTNFQVASSTLDASAKIYAGRVDAIHSETYKVLSGLGRGNDEKENDNVDENGIGEDGEELKKKKKRTRKSNTIETNPKSLNVNKFDLEFEVDPLFHKMSASFDEGGTKGLMMNQLCCHDDASAIVLDSNTVIMNCLNNEATEHSSTMVDLMEFKDIYAGVDMKSLKICPAFSDFEFTNWNKDSTDTFSSSLQDKLAPSTNHAFDLEADVEPIPESQSDINDIPDDGVGFMAGMDDDDDAGSSFSEITQGSDAVFTSISQTVDSIRSGTIGNLMQVLASAPGEYSYFNTNLLSTWAGPSHWKLQPQSKDARFAGLKDKKDKKKKAAFRMNFDDTVDFDTFFKETRAATTLTKSTLEKYSKSQTTLPEDLHYEADSLFKLFIKPKIMVRRQAASSDSLDDGIENYDYDNANDRENYCPGVEADDDDNDMTHAGFDMTAGGSDYGSQSQDLSQGSFGANESIVNGTILAGDNLVAQPNKVSKILIDYAKQAKKMDVKKLKHSIWNFLTHEEEADKENQAETTPAPVKHDNIIGEKSFKELVHTLPESVSKNMARNLSVPITFVCLLHLANEKSLRIVNDDTLTDLRILQEASV